MIKLDKQKKTTQPQPYSGNYFDAKTSPDVYKGKGQIDLDAETNNLRKNDNIAKKSSDAYQKSTGNGSTELTGTPASFGKQVAIAHAYHLASTNNPEYKKHVFAEYQKHMPELIAKHGAKDYDDLVKKSYSAVAAETGKQFKTLPIKTTFHDGELTYPSSGHMLRDVLLHHHLSVFKGGDRHEFLHNVDPENGLNENEKFRAVHDFYGHAIHGNQFGPKGEEVAWEHHKKMFSPLAALAMSAETRGQNSFVNYSGANLELQKKMEETRKERKTAINAGDSKTASEKSAHLGHLGSQWEYAKNASVLLPPHMNSEHYDGHIPESIKKLTPDAGKYDQKKDPKGLVALAKFHNTSSHAGVNGGVLDHEGFKRDLAHVLTLHGHT